MACRVSCVLGVAAASAQEAVDGVQAPLAPAGGDRAVPDLGDGPHLRDERTCQWRFGCGFSARDALKAQPRVIGKRTSELRLAARPPAACHPPSSVDDAHPLAAHANRLTGQPYG